MPLYTQYGNSKSDLYYSFFIALRVRVKRDKRIFAPWEIYDRPFPKRFVRGLYQFAWTNIFSERNVPVSFTTRNRDGLKTLASKHTVCIRQTVRRTYVLLLLLSRIVHGRAVSLFEQITFIIIIRSTTIWRVALNKQEKFHLTNTFDDERE